MKRKEEKKSESFYETGTVWNNNLDITCCGCCGWNRENYEHWTAYGLYTYNDINKYSFRYLLVVDNVAEKKTHMFCFHERLLLECSSVFSYLLVVGRVAEKEEEPFCGKKKQVSFCSFVTCGRGRLWRQSVWSCKFNEEHVIFFLISQRNTDWLPMDGHLKVNNDLSVHWVMFFRL